MCRSAQGNSTTALFTDAHKTRRVQLMIWCGAGPSVGLPWQDVRLPVEERVLALVSNMTMEEKISQLSSDSAALDHLGIASFNWWTGQSCNIP